MPHADSQVLLSAGYGRPAGVVSVLQYCWTGDKRMGVKLCLCTCSSSQLQWGFCVVLHPILQGTLHIGFGIQQQLQRWSGGDTEGHDGRERQRERRVRGRRRVSWLMRMISSQSGSHLCMYN